MVRIVPRLKALKAQGCDESSTSIAVDSPASFRDGALDCPAHSRVPDEQ
jgi:hypothetical protein